MARITTEDCLKNKAIKSHFELVLFAAFRARAIESGEASKLDLHKNRSSAENVGSPSFRNNPNINTDFHLFLDEKSALLALREIAKDVIDLDLIRKQIVNEALYGSFVQNSKLSPKSDCEDVLLEETSESDVIIDDAFYISDSDSDEIEDDSTDEDLSEIDKE